MNRKNLLIAVACMCLMTICRAQTEDAELPVLKGTWKLDSIVQKQGENKTTALLPSKIIPDTIYYSCPVKITFKEDARNCQFLYENEETKDVSGRAYKVQDNIRFYVSLLNNTLVPEWMFYYHLTATKFRIHLILEHNEESSDANAKYEYFYSLIK
jgi:hypothetical protein